jgi:serine/threonine-protein kinase
LLGTTLDGKYRIDRLLGAGAMGSVYEAQHASTGRRVAIKVISSGDLAANAKLVARFQREARAAGAIDTQHITQVLDAGVDRDSNLPFLVMEYLAGTDLSALLKRLGKLAPDLALRIVAQACLGLQKAHDAGVIHRDIKPANLFLAERDAGEIVVKLLDFGIAKLTMEQGEDAESAALTRTGSMLGSPLYMSPEQARGNTKNIDSRADIWSLGVVLYQALTGRTPWHEITALGELILAICQDAPRPVQELAPWVSDEVAAVVDTALRKRADERYQTAKEMFEAIRPLLANNWTIHEAMLVSLDDSGGAGAAPRVTMSPRLSHVGSGSQPGVTGRSLHDDGRLSQSPAQPAAGAGSTGSSRATVGIAAALALALGIGGTYAFNARSHPTPPAAPLTQATPSAVAAPPPPPTVAVATAARPVDTTPRRVKIVILPSDALVELDGVRALARGGILEVTGTLGSVHRIKLTKGKATTQVDIIMTEEGAMPPKVELLFGTAAAKASASAAAAAAVPPPASAAAKALSSAPPGQEAAATAEQAAAASPPATVTAPAAEPAAAPPPPAAPKIDEYE